MNLYCPELRIVLPEELYGFFFYCHSDDGSPCDYLNRFDVSPLDVLKCYVSGEQFDVSPGTVAALRSNGEVLGKLCEELQAASGVDLVRKLEKIYKFCQVMSDWFLCEKLHLKFGMVFLANLRIATGQKWVIGEYRALEKDPEYTMVKLNANEFSPIARVANSLEEAQRANQRKAQDIYNSMTKSKKR